MANKEIHYMSKNGTMFWPATTTTAIIDPTSQEILSNILNKKVSVGIAGNIDSTVLPPIILESIATVSTDLTVNATLIGKTYFCPDLDKIRHYYALEVNQSFQTTPEDTDPSPELIYYDKETDKLYRWNATTQGMVSIVTETSGGMQEITWSALKTLRDGGNLAPGQLYRITDYTCTTAQTDTQSAGHLFDIIVLALSESTLSETAWADHHEGDTYFSNCKLEAWELKYCLDNDTARFMWADTTNGKGVIYWMKDEWNNECSYDFKNIQFRAAINTGTGLFSSFTDVGGVFLYTFTWLTQQNEPQDCSTIFPNSASPRVGKVYNNNIKNTTYDSYQYYLPFNIFYASYIDSYYFGGIRGNSIGKDCDHVVIRAKGTDITNNIVIGNNCNSIRVSGTNILVGNNCSNITTGTRFDDIIIGNNCTNITLAHPTDSTKSLYYQHIIIESHVENLQLYPESTPNYNTKFKNILIQSGISGESSNNQKYIYTSVDNDFLTTYKPANSVEISV